MPSQAAKWLFDRTCELVVLLKLHRGIENEAQRATRLRLLAGVIPLIKPRMIARFNHHLSTSSIETDIIPLNMLRALRTNITTIFHRHTRRHICPPLQDDLQKLIRWQGTIRGLIDKLSSTEWSISKQEYTTFRDQALTKGARTAHQITKLSMPLSSTELRPSFTEEVQIEEKKWHKLWKTECTPTDFSVNTVPQGAAFTRQAIRSAAASFDMNTSCLDGIPIKCVALCSNMLLDCLSRVAYWNTGPHI